ncbi:MAG: hypothetical protein AAB513_03265 [Patescibacteria group bacterium]
MNTVKSGQYRWLVFKEDDSWIGVVLEFNIVITGEDPKLVQFELHEAALGYIESTAKMTKGFRQEQVNNLLNQKTEKEYEIRWTTAMQRRSIKKTADKIPSPFYSAGVSPIVV